MHLQVASPPVLLLIMVLIPTGFNPFRLTRFGMRSRASALNLVVNAVKGDPEEGEDGRLYEALGYVRKSDRRAGPPRRRKIVETVPMPVSVAF